METEKITINLPPVDVGKIDLLVGQGLFASRSDLIRAGLRRILDQHEDVVAHTVTRRSFLIGVESFGREGLEKMRTDGQRLRVRVVGMLHIGQDVSPELADEVFERIRVVGVFRAPKDVQDRLAPKLRRGLNGADE